MKNCISILKNIWKQNNFKSYKEALAQLEPINVRDVVSFLANPFDMDSPHSFKFYEATLLWLRENNKTHLGAWANEEKKIITQKSVAKLKDKNKNYINFLSLFIENKNIVDLPFVFTSNWPEGWTLFNQYIEGMPSKLKSQYWLNSFIYANEAMRKEINSYFSLSSIQEIISTNKTIGYKNFWALRVPIDNNFSDKEITLLLKWADAMGVGMKAHHNIDNYISIDKPETLNFLLNNLGVKAVSDAMEQNFPALAHISKDKEKSFKEIQDLRAIFLSYSLQESLNCKLSQKKVKI